MQSDRNTSLASRKRPRASEDHELRNSKIKTSTKSDASLNEAYGPVLADIKPPVALQNDEPAKLSKTTVPLPFSPLSIEMARWRSTPFTLVPVNRTQFCPRLDAFDVSGELYEILGKGQHALGPAIAKIRWYGYKQPIRCDARRVLRVFDEIHHGYCGSPYVTLLDSSLCSGSFLEEQERFRRKEWGWLVRAGRPLLVQDVLQGSWDLVTIAANYARLKISLILYRVSHTIEFAPGPGPTSGSGPDYENPPPRLDDIQVRYYVCNV